MSDTERTAVTYVSPDGQHEMPVRSPAKQINLESRGWTRKDGQTPVSNSPSTPAETKRPAPRRREAADE